MPQCPTAAHLPSRLVSLSRSWVLTAVYYRGTTLLETVPLMQKLLWENEQAVAVGLIAQKYERLKASCVVLVVNQLHNEHSVADVMRSVGGPLKAIGIKVGPIFLIHKDGISEHQLRERYQLSYRKGTVTSASEIP